MDNKQKVELSKAERTARKFGNDEKVKKYKISQIANKQGVTIEEAEIIYNQRIQKQRVISKSKKKKGSSTKNESYNTINSVYTSLDGVTGARTWKNVK